MKTKEIRNVNGIDKLKCSKCNYWLPFNEYGNNKYTSTGKQSYCKTCQKYHYDIKRKVKSNSSIVGMHIINCEQCSKDFMTKTFMKVFCSDKCRKRNWYEKNERGMI